MAKIFNFLHEKIRIERKRAYESMKREGLEIDLKVLDQEIDEIAKLLNLAKNTASQIKKGPDESQQ